MMCPECGVGCFPFQQLPIPNGMATYYACENHHPWLVTSIAIGELFRDVQIVPAARMDPEEIDIAREAWEKQK